MEARLRQALLQAEEVTRALADPGVGKDPEKLRALGREHTRLAQWSGWPNASHGCRTSSNRLGDWLKSRTPSLSH